MRCPHCGAELTDGARFCHVCTAPVTGGASPRAKVSDDSVEEILREYRARHGKPEPAATDRDVRQHVSQRVAQRVEQRPDRAVPERPVRRAEESAPRRSRYTEDTAVADEPAQAPLRQRVTVRDDAEGYLYSEEAHHEREDDRRDEHPQSRPDDADYLMPEPRKKPVKKSQKALWISIIALLLVIAIVSGVIFIVTTVNAKEVQQAKDNYQPPAKAVSVDLTQPDPSNDQIKFNYDDRARIVSCTYKVNNKQYDQQYTYEDEAKTLDVATFYKKHTIDEVRIPYSDIPQSGFTSVDGIIVGTKPDAAAPLETVAPTAAPTEAAAITPASELVADTELNSFLTFFIVNYYDYSGEYKYNTSTDYKEFDCRHATDNTQNILTNVCYDFTCVSYHGDGNYWNNTDTNKTVTTFKAKESCPWADELVNDYGMVFRRDRADWICKNIFHITDEEIATLYDRGFSDKRIWKTQLDDGEYYCAIQQGKGGPMEKAKVTDVKTDGRFYYVTYDYCNIDVSSLEATDPIASYYAVLSRVNIDGSDYWTMYYNTGTVPDEITPFDPEGR